MSNITRRNFVNGTLMAAGASVLPIGGASQAVMAALVPSYYPPARTGLRGTQDQTNMLTLEHGAGSRIGGQTRT